MSTLVAILIGYALGGACVLGLVWRRLSRAAHLLDELQELYGAGCEIMVPTAMVNYHACGRPIFAANCKAEDMRTFNRRLASARDLMDAIERRER